MNTNARQVTCEESLDQACAWVARLRSDAMSPKEKRDFAAWLSMSEKNRCAFQDITALWGDLGALSYMPLDQLLPESELSATRREFAKVSPSMETTANKVPKRGVWDLPQWILSGGLATCTVLFAAWIGFQWMASEKPNALIFITQTGEIRTVNLSDGSEIKLNSNSELHVNYSREERRTQLVRGEAFFEVARQTARPFSVAAGSAKIRVLGTEFNVELNPKSTRVSVTEGTVSVSEADSAPGLAPESVKLGKNQKVSVFKRGLSDVRRTSLEEAKDWTRGLLVFEKTPLKEALLELNRYLKVPAVATPQVEGRLVSGTFAVSDPDNTLEAIATVLHLQQDRSNSNLTILSPKHK
ncbi:FecR family protein [Microbulbifer spongiae]|uniref:FecR domain-containing protein n=1 Tax=Microbulbifer spongiae TaxID=2944933 RepID=A0ABY9E9W5_9GAMM|nr:FecR domain-containing protein [Microbulbifer sp. MI-G]WKD49127.1 FecR domain-containing protein [Microbulbifer sp. MI-G]